MVKAMYLIHIVKIISFILPRKCYVHVLCLCIYTNECLRWAAQARGAFKYLPLNLSMVNITYLTYLNFCVKTVYVPHILLYIRAAI